MRRSSLSPFVSRFSRKCGILDVSQSYGPLRPVTGIDLPVPCPIRQRPGNGGKYRKELHRAAYVLNNISIKYNLKI
jgi:hypothetical protein